MKLSKIATKAPSTITKEKAKLELKRMSEEIGSLLLNMFYGGAINWPRKKVMLSSLLDHIMKIY